jgi:hypothetical protein
MTVKFTNNASATLATSINTSVTSISVTAGQGAQFPSLTSGEFFYATLVDSSNNLEIVKVTARSSDTLTVVRGQDSTTHKSYIAGDKLELRVVAAALNGMVSDASSYTDTSVGTVNTSLTNHLNDTSDAHDASAISFSPAGNIAATDVQAAIAELDTEKLAATATVTGANGITTSGTLGSGVTISPTSGYNGYGARTVSASAPSGGSDGDIWYKV